MDTYTHIYIFIYTYIFECGGAANEYITKFPQQQQQCRHFSIKLLAHFRAATRRLPYGEQNQLLKAPTKQVKRQTNDVYVYICVCEYIYMCAEASERITSATTTIEFRVKPKINEHKLLCCRKNMEEN